MNDRPPPDPQESVAARRYVMMQLARILALGLVSTGIAIANGKLPAPYWLGVAVAVAGLITFFFGPPVLAKRWKAGDRERGEP